MLNIPNYQIGTQIYESANSLVYRGVRKKNNQPVILKVLKEDYPTPEELTRYRQEYEITKSLNLEGVIATYHIEKYQNTLVIVLEDFGGESLKNLLNPPQSPFAKVSENKVEVHSFEAGGLIHCPVDFDGVVGVQSEALFGAEQSFALNSFIPLAIQITEALGNIHAANIIHKDINPANIVWNQETNQLKIIDFGIASRLPRENPVLKNPEQLEGTLAYISPEQTGRMNRSLDYRTDLYSLGVTFYELLTGKLPYESTDALELVHCHIAKTPKPVSEMNPEIPPIISDIVMKLMAKNVEDRYQSAFGVKFDLEKVFKKISPSPPLQKGGVPHLDKGGLGGILNFELAQNDFSGKLQIPQKLYGRENEINTLLQAFERVSNGATEMMLVAGYSGVGKTALVHEVHKPMTEKHGYFAAGKFDQFQKNIPYSALTQAFNKFCRYLLMENAETLANWQTKILAAVGNNGQIIIDMIPDLELVIGSQPAVAEVGPTETQNRFQMFFLNFVKALCNKEHPFILFIDDLQWVDLASLALLKSIMLDDEIKHLFIIGAYRDNEVNSNHPFVMAVSELQKANVIINTISLANLLVGDLNRLLQDSLDCETTLTQPLTVLIYQKTQGNAFFTHQFLQTLYFEALLRFDFIKLKWQWDVEQIAAQNITANVVELMANKIDKLPSQTSKVLQLAACIGNQFDLSILAIIYEHDQHNTLSVLRPALAEGLIQPLDENYKHLETARKAQFKFLHDRVQQAAYALIDNDQKKAVHLQIGHVLLKNTPADALEEKVFDIVGHFNHSMKLLNNQAERLQIVDLFLKAGQKAKMATAYEAATQYLNVGIENLPEESWQKQYELTFELYKQCAECEYLLTHVEQSEKLFRLALDNAQTALEKSEIYAIQIVHSMAFSKLDEAFERVRNGLRLCGMDFPADEQILSVVQTESEQLAKLMENKPISILIDAPQMTDKTKMVAMRILPNLALISYLSGNNNLLTLSILMAMNLSLTYGQLDLSAYIYSWYGVWLSGQGRFKEAYEFGQLALELSDRYPNCREKSQTHNLVGTFLIHINQPLKHSLPVLMKGYHTGFESGDVAPGNLCFGNIGTQMFAAGETLPNVLAHLKKVTNIADKNKVFIIDIAYGYEQLVQFLMTSDVECTLTDATFAKKQLQRIKANNTIAFIMHVRLHKAFWFGNYTMSGEIVLNRLLEKMMLIVIENAGAEKGFLLLPQKDQWFIEAEGQVDSDEVHVLQSLPLENQPIAQTIIHYVERTQENVVLNNASQEGQFTRDPYIVKQRPKSILCAPLKNQGQLTGILYLENHLTTGAFTPQRLEVLTVLSSQLAISIENALLYRTLEQKVEERTAQLAEANEEITVLNEQLKSENLRMSAELDVSRQLQQMLLPKDKELQAIESLDIAGFMEPAEEVGGDYYDVLQYHGRILFGIGDVTGHGLESGALAIMVQSSIRTLLANNETDPVKFFSALNQMVYHNVQRMNAEKSLTLALVNYQDNQLYLSGQHEEIIVVRSGKLELIDTMDLGFPIGLDEDMEEFVHQIKVPLNYADVVVLYTDGITEAENMAGKMYGLERLCEIISQNWHLSAQKIQQAVIEDVRQFIGKQKVFDDITLLVLKQQ
jgi:predicted ATPase/serine phosphatase RsbU (regulator of sigma subunit)/tRNA A-37 threonylcarbamoyl transferase component Bud32